MTDDVYLCKIDDEHDLTNVRQALVRVPPASAQRYHRVRAQLDALDLAEWELSMDDDEIEVVGILGEDLDELIEKVLGEDGFQEYDDNATIRLTPTAAAALMGACRLDPQAQGWPITSPKAQLDPGAIRWSGYVGDAEARIDTYMIVYDMLPQPTEQEVPA